VEHKKIAIVILSALLFIGGISYCYASESAYKRAHKAFLASRYEEAIIGYTKYLKQEPHNENAVKTQIELSEAYFKLANKYYDQGDYETAEKLFYSANSEAGDNWVAKCRLKLAERDYKEAQYEKSIEKLNLIGETHCSPELYSSALMLKIKCFYKLNKEQKCLAVCQKLSNISHLELPRGIKTILDKIAIHYIRKADDASSKNKFDEAIQTYSEIDKIPTSYKEELETKRGNVYLMWALTYKDQGDYENAIEVLERAKKNGIVSTKIDQALANNRFSLFVKKGNLAYKYKEWREARGFYKEALEYMPNDQYVKERLAQISKKLKFGTVYDFENGILVKMRGYSLGNSCWLKGEENAGKFSRYYNSPGGISIVEVISEGSSKNAAILSFTILMAPSYFSAYQDVYDLFSFLADATGGNIPIGSVSRFIVNNINTNGIKTKWFGNFKIMVNSDTSLGTLEFVVMVE